MQYFDRGASPAELKLQYRAHCVRYHPDLGGDHQQFVEMARQYRALLDPDSADDEPLDFTIGEDIMQEALITANSRIECYCNFGGGVIAFQTFDAKVGFVVQEGVTELYARLKARSLRHEGLRGNAQGRTVLLTGREFSDLWHRRIGKPTQKQHGTPSRTLGRARRSPRLTGSR